MADESYLGYAAERERQLNKELITIPTDEFSPEASKLVAEVGRKLDTFRLATEEKLDLHRSLVHFYEEELAIIRAFQSGTSVGVAVKGERASYG